MSIVKEENTKKKFLKKWKEVEELYMTREFMTEMSVVTDNELDKGLSDYEMNSLTKGKFPETLYRIDGRIDELYLRFEQWIEERASTKVMINQLLDYQIFDTVSKLSEEIFDHIKDTIPEERDLALEKHSIYKTLCNSKNKSRVMHRRDVYEALVTIWYHNVRLPIAEGKLEAQPQSYYSEANTPIPTPNVLDAQLEKMDNSITKGIEDVTTEIGSKRMDVRNSIDQARDGYISILESQVRRLDDENNVLSNQLDSLYIKLGKHYLTMIEA